MLRSALARNTQLRLPKIRFSSSQEIIAYNGLKLHHVEFPSNNSKINLKHFVSVPIKVHNEVPLAPERFCRNAALLGMYRYFSDSENVSMPSQAEMHLINILKEKFPLATDIAVNDISGGCGAMYEIFVESPDFKGIRIVKQHQMITEALKGEIKDMHGLRITTTPS